MSSTDSAASATRPAGRTRQPTPLTELLVLIGQAADSAKVAIKQVRVTEVTGEVFLDLATEGDVGRFIDDLGKTRLDIDVKPQADIGVIATSYDGTWLGWSLHVQHVHRLPTLQEGTTPA